MFKIAQHTRALSAIAATVLISSVPVLGADLGGAGNRRWSPRRAPGVFLTTYGWIPWISGTLSDQGTLV